MRPIRFFFSLEGGMDLVRLRAALSLLRGSVRFWYCSAYSECIISIYILLYPLDMQHEGEAIICDPGTGYMKMGFAGDNFPKASFASLVGRPMLRSEETLGEEVQLKEIMVGD